MVKHNCTIFLFVFVFVKKIIKVVASLPDDEEPSCLIYTSDLTPFLEYAAGRGAKERLSLLANQVSNAKPKDTEENSASKHIGASTIFVLCQISTKIIAKSHTPFFCEEKLLFSVQFHSFFIVSLLGLKTKTFHSEMSTLVGLTH